MLNSNLGLHAESNVSTSLHQNTDLKADASAQGKTFVDKVKDAAAHVGEQVSNVGKQIGDAISTIGNKDARLEPVLSNVVVPTPNERHDIPPHNQTFDEKPHWHAHAHTEEVSNSGVLNQGAFVDGVGNNILDKESEKHGVLASEKPHFDAHPHTHDVANSGALNQAAFVGGASILAKESEKHGAEAAAAVNASGSHGAHYATHDVPANATLAENVYAQGSVQANTGAGFVAHPDHSGAHAGMFDKVGSDLIAKEQKVEAKAESSSEKISAAASNLIEQGKEKVGQIGEKLGEMGDKVKAALDSNTSASTSTSASANVHTSAGLGL